MLDRQPPTFMRGDATGLAIPAHSESLRAAGESFLTDAFRAFGSISPRNRIARITRFESFRGGNSARSSCYRRISTCGTGAAHRPFRKILPRLHRCVPRSPAQRAEGEVRLAALSRLPSFRFQLRSVLSDFHRRIRHRRSHHAAGRLWQRQHRAAPSKCRDHGVIRSARLLPGDRDSLARLAAAQ